MIDNNIIIDTDAYKLTHHLQYPDGLVKLYSYGEPRGGRYPKIMFFGLQAIIKEYLVGTVVTTEKINYAERKAESYFGNNKYFNRAMWEHIRDEHGGKLPIEIKAVREGTILNTSNVCFTIENLDDKCGPLTNSIETLLMHAWYTTTIATNSKLIRDIIQLRLEESGTPELIDFMCHDFGYRGGTCQQQSGMGGMSHMVNFMGSDTCIADRYIDHYYGGIEGSRLKSVLATEHSVATSYGPGEGELNYVNSMLDRAPDDAIISLVGDSYDIYNFCENVIGNHDIKKRINNRKGRVVIRPDSGSPNIVILKCLNILATVFGFTRNSKDYFVINANVGLLQGDGMDLDSIDDLYRSLFVNKWSADNLVVGSGGGLLQKGFDRDTSKWAIKASYGEFLTKEGKRSGMNIQKDPTTASFKKSKTGKLKLHPTGIKSSPYTTLSSTEAGFDGYVDSMVTVFKNGELVNPQTFDDIVDKAKEGHLLSEKDEVIN